MSQIMSFKLKLYLCSGLLLMAAIPFSSELLRVADENSYAGHSIFVPVFSAFLIWIDRHELRALLSRGNLLGTPLLIAGAALTFLGTVLGSLALLALSLVAILSGVALTLKGKPALKRMALPIGLLLLTPPLPYSVVGVISPHLQLFAAHFTGSVLSIFGIPYHQVGIMLALPQVTLEIAEACNGLRFLMALWVLSIAIAHVTQRTTVRKVILSSFAIPIAIIANGFRIASIALAAYYIGPSAAVGLTHHAIGKAVWLTSLIPLALLTMFLSRRRTPPLPNTRSKSQTSTDDGWGASRLHAAGLHKKGNA